MQTETMDLGATSGTNNFPARSEPPVLQPSTAVHPASLANRASPEASRAAPAASPRTPLSVAPTAPARPMTTQPSSAQVDAGPTIDLDAEKVRSSIAEGDIIEGNLKCKTGISIAGTVLGDVSCESGAIVVTETGNVVGSLIGKEKIFINGHVGQDGQPAPKITTPGMVVLNTCAVVNADIEYGKLATFGDMTHNGTSRKIASQR